MAIVLLRHGETALNASRVLQPEDTPLSERGRAQAKALANSLTKRSIAAIVCSDLLRARQTAAEISSTTGIVPTYSSLLQERNFGALRGTPYDALGFDPIAMQDAPSGGESMLQFQGRVAEAFAMLLDYAATRGEDLLVVTHALTIAGILQQHLQLPDGATMPRRLANTSVTAFELQPPHRISVLNDDQHLEREISDDTRGVAGV
jgi:broad specificity phosphatase PhoE